MPYHKRVRIFSATILLACLPSFAQNNQIHLNVDATDAPRRLYHVHLTVPAKSGPMTLVYPKWIPGEHMPTGPIADLVGLKIQAAVQTIGGTKTEKLAQVEGRRQL